MTPLQTILTCYCILTYIAGSFVFRIAVNWRTFIVFLLSPIVVPILYATIIGWQLKTPK